MNSLLMLCISYGYCVLRLLRPSFLLGYVTIMLDALWTFFEFHLGYLEPVI